ncbi:MAG: ABC transporter permease subunit [Spirochaetaceae bacterium]|jgi:putative aldouronate transport system permease protein|nr:ABC transporter permease subunit [Spirochaetaceae bacterium]
MAIKPAQPLVKNRDAFLDSGRKNINVLIRDWRLYCLLVPMLAWYVLFVYKPMGGLLVAFKDYKPDRGIINSDFAGFYNFFKLMFDATFKKEFWGAFRNTFMISLYGLIFAFPIPIILAILFSEIVHEPYRKLTQTITYLPYFLSEVTITGLVLMLLKESSLSTGILARAMLSLGFTPDGKILETARYFRPLFCITGIWKEAGYSSIVFFAAIMGVSPTLYEALRVDGGNKIQELRFVTLPGISVTLTIMLIMRIGHMLSVGYERVILLYNVSTYATGDVLSTLAYRLALFVGTQSNTGMGSAIDMFNSVIGFFLVIGANYVSRRVSTTSLW